MNFWDYKPGAQVAWNKVLLLCIWLRKREGVPTKAFILPCDLSQTKTGHIQIWCGSQTLAFQNQNKLPNNPVLALG